MQFLSYLKNPKKYQTYLYDYYYDGSRWSLEITAKTKEDADKIIQRIPLAKYVGVLSMRIPAITKNSWLADIIIWWKNRSHGK